MLLFVRAFTNLQQHLCILRNVLLFLHQDIFVYIHVYLFAPIYICLQLSPVGHRRNDTLKVVKKMATRKALSVAKTSVWYGFNRRSKKTPYTVPGSVVLNISGRNSERPKWSQKGMRLKYLLSFLIWKKGRGYFKTNRYQHLY